MKEVKCPYCQRSGNSEYIGPGNLVREMVKGPSGSKISDNDKVYRCLGCSAYYGVATVSQYPIVEGKSPLPAGVLH